MLIRGTELSEEMQTIFESQASKFSDIQSAYGSRLKEQTSIDAFEMYGILAVVQSKFRVAKKGEDEDLHWRDVLMEQAALCIQSLEIALPAKIKAFLPVEKTVPAEQPCQAIR